MTAARRVALALALLVAAEAPRAQADDAGGASDASSDAAQTAGGSGAATNATSGGPIGTGAATSGTGAATSGTGAATSGTSAATSGASAVASGTSATAEEAPAPHHRVRRRRRARRVHGRARRGGLARARGAVLTLGWRYTSMPTDGLGGSTHGVDLLVHPFARLRGPWRFARLTVGGEVALRLARPDTVDTTTWAVLGMGAQWPGRWFTPYATLLVQAGVGTRYRFLTTIVEPAVLVGLEAGTDLRLVGFAGVNVGLGVGRVQVGSQWSYAAWLRASVALF